MGFHKKTIRDVPIDNHTVLVRVNYDIPVNNSGEISDDLWIRSSLPTIEYLLNRDCKVIVVSHHGKPVGCDAKYSLEPAAARLARLLRRDIRFVSEVVGDRVLQAIKKSPGKSVIVLENLRFYPGEDANDSDFARKLVHSTGARYFVQDGFGVAGNRSATTDVITDFVPSVAGLALEQDYLTILKVVDLTGAKNRLDLPGVEVLLDVGR
ncbi:MAG: phosphoglycerate kinase [Candidatus Saccharibacteria bacterium]